MSLLLSPDGILLASAIIPAVVLLVLVYRADHMEKEPPLLLLKLVVFGVIATSVAKLLEYVGVYVLNSVFRYESLLYDILLYFGVVAFSEEGAKYALLKRATWNSPDFNCRFDGVVYATFVSLGFALWENVGYVLQYGFQVALMRAVTAIPGHACFGVFMGCWYAQARMLALRGDEASSKAMRTASVVLPALIHGAYDFLAVTASTYLPAWSFLLFIAALFLVTFRLVRRLSRNDHYI